MSGLLLSDRREAIATAALQGLLSGDIGHHIRGGDAITYSYDASKPSDVVGAADAAVEFADALITALDRAAGDTVQGGHQMSTAKDLYCTPVEEDMRLTLLRALSGDDIDRSEWSTYRLALRAASRIADLEWRLSIAVDGMGPLGTPPLPRGDGDQ